MPSFAQSLSQSLSQRLGRSLSGKGLTLLPVSSLVHTRNSEAYITYADRTDYFATPHQIASRVINGVDHVQVESAAANLIDYSNDISNAWWVKNEVTVNTGQIDPSGGSTACSIIESSATAEHKFTVGNIGDTLDGASQYTTSHFFAPLGQSIYMDSGNSGFNLWPRVTWNPDTKSFVSVDQCDDSGFIEAGNNYCRVCFTGTSDAAVAARAYRYLNTLAPYAGDGASGLYSWCTQFELGAHASSPIVTSGSNATRPAVSAYWPSFPAWVSSSKIKIRWIPYFNVAGGLNCYLFEFGDGSRLQYYSGAFYVADSGGVKLTTSPVTISKYQPVTFTIDTPNSTLTIEGADSGDGEYSNLAWTFPTTGNLYLGSQSGTNNFCNGLISVPYKV